MFCLFCGLTLGTFLLALVYFKLWEGIGVLPAVVDWLGLKAQFQNLN